MVVELRLVEQRYQVVLELLEGAKVTGVGPAVRSGPPEGAGAAGPLWCPALAGPADASSSRCPVLTRWPPAVEVSILELRPEQPTSIGHRQVPLLPTAVFIENNPSLYLPCSRTGRGAGAWTILLGESGDPLDRWSHRSSFSRWHPWSALSS